MGNGRGVPLLRRVTLAPALSRERDSEATAGLLPFPRLRQRDGGRPPPRSPTPAHRYNTVGSHNPISGNTYSSTSANTWIAMNGSMPPKIWFSVTCGGATPFR